MDIGVQHLIEASRKLECSIDLTAKALVLYHHFMRCMAGTRMNKSMAAAAVLYLSSRVTEQFIDHDVLMCVFYTIVNKTTNVLATDDRPYILMRKSLTRLDYLVQRMFEFNPNHRIAHQYLVPFLELINERCPNIAEFRTEISKTCMRLLTDFYTSSICINYKPDHIAIACIDLSLYIHGLIVELVIPPAWYLPFCTDITTRKVKQIKDDMMDFYKRESPFEPEVMKQLCNIIRT